MFKITEERIINIVLALGMLIFIVVAKVSDEEKKTAKINELKMNSNETEAITYNYRIDRVLKGKYHETK